MKIKNMNQKTLNIIFGVIIIILTGIIVYLSFGIKLESINNQHIVIDNSKNTQTTTQASPTSTDLTAEWKVYSNNRYAYTIKYPTDWFVKTIHSEKDFTPRGLANDIDFIGGDTYWSNYSGDYGLSRPDDYSSISLLIYKSDSPYIQETLWYSDKENITINGIHGIRITTIDTENANKIYKSIMLKVDEKIFYFHCNKRCDESEVAVMNQMIQTFRLK